MARKTKKYSFQRNKKKTLAWVIGIVAVIAAIVIGVLVYNSTLTGDIEVPAPDAAKLNNIAENWKVLESNTDKFMNYYAGSEDGTDGNGATMLAYLGSAELLTPVNVLLYQLVWLVPGLLITEWTRTV